MISDIQKTYTEEYREVTKGIFMSMRGGVKFLDESDRTNYGDIERLIHIDRRAMEKLSSLSQHDPQYEQERQYYLRGLRTYANQCENQAHYWEKSAYIFSVITGFITIMLFPQEIAILKYLLIACLFFFSIFSIAMSLINKKRASSNISFHSILFAAEKLGSEIVNTPSN